MQVPLNYIVLIRIKVVDASGQKDTLSLARRLWLCDIGLPVLFHLLLSLTELLFEVPKFSWKKPRLGEVVILLREKFLHTLEIPSQVIFTGKSVHPWEMINSLIRFHAVELLDFHCAIGPEDIPLVVGVLILGMILGA